MSSLQTGRRCASRRALRWITATALLSLGALTAPAAAMASGGAAANSATMVSEAGDWIGGGSDRAFVSPESTVSIRGGNSSVEVQAAGTRGSFSFSFEAPDGRQLEVGEYTRATRSASKGGAGLSVTGEGRGCNTDYGRFIVKDIHVNAEGTVDRFWALYEQHCGGPESPALFGEVRIGEPAVQAPQAVPSAVAWPQTAVGQRSVVVPITISAGEAGSPIVSVTLTGEDAADFSIAYDECQGQAHGTCSVGVLAGPAAAGLGDAQLLATDESGATSAIALSVDTEPPPEPLMTTNTATLVSEPGDYIGGGADRLFDAPESVSVRGERSWAQVTAEADGESFQFEFEAPWGRALEDGEYTGAYGSPASAWPGLRVGGDGRGCNNALGRFIVKDIHFNGAGQVDRLWALYEQHCETSGGRVEPALFGEVRVGEPASEAPEVVAPAAVDWPQTAVGARGVDVPVIIGAGETAVHIASVALEGEDAGDFTIASDECAAAELAPRARCELAVAAEPTAAGPSNARLIVTDSSGARTAVQLSVDTEPPVEALMSSNTATLVSEPGDYIGGGSNRLIDAPEAVYMNGERSFAEVRAEAEGGSFTFEFAPPFGRELEVGEYTGAKRYPFQKHAAGLTVSGDGRGCNTAYGRFTVKDIHFTGAGRIERLWALYEQHCEGKHRPPLFGEVRVGEPAGDAPEIVAPATVQWPETPIRRRGVDVPVTIGAGESGAKIASVTLQGADPTDFEIVNDECDGLALAPRARCEVVLAAVPRTAGVRTAQLLITDASGVETSVPVSVNATR